MESATIVMFKYLSCLLEKREHHSFIHANHDMTSFQLKAIKTN